MFVTTTIAMVYWTVFVQGITIKPLVKFLNVKTMSEKDPTMNERIAGRFMDHVVSGMEGILGELGNLRCARRLTLLAHLTSRVYGGGGGEDLGECEGVNQLTRFFAPHSCRQDLIQFLF